MKQFLNIFTLSSKVYLATFGIFLFSCGPGPDSTVTDVRPVEVTLGSARPPDREFISVSGTIEPSNTAMISTKLMGHVTRIGVSSGERVKKGQLLIEISATDVLSRKAQAEAMVTEASAALAIAETDLQRFRELHASNSATTKELENATLQHASALARKKAASENLKEAVALLSYTHLTAPFDGVVTRKNIDLGSLAHPGQVLLVVEQTNMYQIKAAIQEKDIERIEPRSAVKAFAKGGSVEMDGTITEINPSSQFSGGQYEVTIDLDTEGSGSFNSGMYVTVRIPVSRGASDNTILVPVDAIVKRDQLNGLYSVGQSGTAVLRWLRLGKTYGNEVEVLSGLSAGETFILRSNGRLYDGVPVVASEDQSAVR